MLFRSMDSGFRPSGFRIPTIWVPDFDPQDSGFQPSGFRIPTIWIPDTTIWIPDSEFFGFQIPNHIWLPDSIIVDSTFQQSNFAGFRIPDSVTWVDKIIKDYQGYFQIKFFVHKKLYSLFILL